MRWLSLLVVLSLLLAGCSGGEAPESPAADEPVSKEKVKVADGVETAANRGAIVGFVTSDAGLFIAGARVSLIGQPQFGDSNDKGRFKLVDVVDGEHTLQVQADGFRVHEQTVAVGVGKATWANVTLMPREELSPTKRPHVHDLWKGRTEYDLVNMEYDLTKRPGFRGGSNTLYPLVYWPSMVLYPNTNTQETPLPVPTQPDGSPSIVYPGAGEMVISLDWDTTEDSTKETLGMHVWVPGKGRLELDPGPPGVTWTIPLNHTNHDGGHDAWTAYRFWLQFPNAVYSPASWDPGINLGSLHFVVTVKRGDEPPLEPAHEDFWGDNDTLVLRDASQQTSYGGYPESARETFPLLLSEDKIVPPGTQRLLARLEWEFTNEVTPAVWGDEYNLMWRTAAQNPFTTTWDEYTLGEPVESGERYKVYDILVKPGETDKYYASRSDWSFSAARPGEEDSATDWGAQNRDRVFTLEVIAVKDSSWTG